MDRAAGRPGCPADPGNLADSDRSDQRLFDSCAADGVLYVPFFPLGSAFAVENTVLTAPTVVTSAGRLGMTPAQVALALLLQRSPNVLLIPGNLLALACTGEPGGCRRETRRLGPRRPRLIARSTDDASRITKRYRNAFDSAATLEEAERKRDELIERLAVGREPAEKDRDSGKCRPFTEQQLAAGRRARLGRGKLLRDSVLRQFVLTGWRRLAELLETVVNMINMAIDT